MSTISTGAYPPGPKVSYLDGLLIASRLSDPLRFLTSIARKYGDVAHFQIGARPIFLLNHPEPIKDALTNYYENFSKTDSARKSRHFLGDGLITGEGDYHRSQRQLIRPAFCPQRIVAHASLIVEHGLRCRESWQDGQTLDVSREMSAEADEINRAVSVVLSQFSLFGKPFTRTLERLFRLRRTKRAQARIDEIIHKQISVRRDGVKSPDDLLSLLMSLDVGAGQRMTGRQLRDEALTIFLAGHETVAPMP